MLRSTIIALLMLPLCAVAQFQYESHDWEAEPRLHDISESDKDELAIGLKDFRMVEVWVDQTSQRMLQYTTKHQQFRINSADVIDDYNKIFIPSYTQDDLVSIKARIITADGRVLESGKDKVRMAQTEEGMSGYKYLALEGVELGCEVEYMYTTIEGADYKGTTERFQDNMLSYNAEFHLIAPEQFGFIGKSYNGWPELTDGEVLDGKQHLTARLDKVPALKSESYAAYRASLMAVAYKLDRVQDVIESDAITYSKAGSDVFGMLYSQPEKSVLKAIDKDLKTWKIADKPVADQARVIEAELKAKYRVVPQRTVELEDLKSVMKNALCSEVGIMRLFAAYYGAANIDFAVVLSCDRFKQTFDKDFDSYDGLREYLMYIIEPDLYIAPASVGTRMQYVAPEVTGNHGLFVRFLKYGDQVQPLSEVRYIPTLDHKANMDNMLIDLNVDLDEVALEFTLERSFKGYSAYSIGPVMQLVEENQRTEILTELLNHGNEDATVEDMTYKNDDIDVLYNSAFTFSGKVTAPNMIEKAGPKYLIKIGETIGPQVEMYQPEERKLNVENQYNRSYNRTLTLHIPEGYKITNPEALNIDIFHEADGVRTCTFTSSFALEGQDLKVNIEEFYNEIRYDKKDFEPFREVINAAADFNKVVLFLEKK